MFTIVTSRQKLASSFVNGNIPLNQPEEVIPLGYNDRTGRWESRRNRGFTCDFPEGTKALKQDFTQEESPVQ